MLDWIHEMILVCGPYRKDFQPSNEFITRLIGIFVLLQECMDIQTSHILLFKKSPPQDFIWNPFIRRFVVHELATVHTVSFDWFLPGLEWIIYFEFC